MKKIRTRFEKIEKEEAILSSGDSVIRMPQKELEGFLVGDDVVITLASAEVDLEKSDEVARALLLEVFREEKS